MLKLISIFLLFLTVVSSQAADIYFAQTAQGADTGADAADAHSVAWYNSNNTAPNTYHVCGTITTEVTMSGSTTLVFESGAKFSAPTWGDGTAIITGASDCTIDGLGTGIIEATANGTGLANSNGITAIKLVEKSGVTVQNLTIQNLYVNKQGPDENGGGIGVGDSWNGGNSFYDVTVSNCVLHDMRIGVSFAFGPACSNFVMTHCASYACNWNGEMAVEGSGRWAQNLTFDHNHFYNWTNWDDVSDLNHHNGVFVFANTSGAGGMLTNVTVAENYFGPKYGGAIGYSGNSGATFMEGNIFNILVNNNIFDASDGTSPADAMCFLWMQHNTGSIATTPQVLNNTFIGGLAVNFYDGFGSGLTTYKLYGNSFYSNGSCIYVAYNVDNALLSDSNSFYAATVSTPFSTSVNSAGNSQNYATWQGYGYDTHSIAADPKLNSAYQPQSGSSLIAAAMNFGSQFTTDYAGNIRPATGAWTIGAYAVANTNMTPAISVTPSTCNFGPVAVGASTNQTFTVQNTGSGTLAGSASASAPFAIVSGGSYSLTAGQSQTVTVSYSPTIAGTNNQTVTFTGAGGSSGAVSGAAYVPLGTISVTPSSRNFGTAAVGASTNQTFTVQNTGSGTLTGSASVAAPFSIVSGGSYSLGAGQSQTVTVSYSPTAAGTNSQTMSFTGAGGGTGAVSGTAVAPPAVSAITMSGADVDANAAGLQIFAGSVVQYSCSASDPNGLPLTWQWSYTVNGGAQTVVQSGTGTVASVSFNYTASMAGNTYVWTLLANNGYSTAASRLTVGVEAPPAATASLTFSAGDGVITAPFVLTNGYISQPVQTTDPTLGGQAVFTFTITNAGNYVIQALVNAPNDANNSFFADVDAQPSNPTNIWDIPITAGFEQRIVSWRGNGTDTANQFVPAIFNLSAGVHQLIIVGREMDVQLQTVAILYDWAPSNLQVVTPSP